MSVEKSPANLAMAAQLRAEQKANGLTQEQLAAASGINYETLKRILKGTRDINVTQIVALADAFGMSPQKLVQLASERLERMNKQSLSEGVANNVTRLHPRDRNIDQLEQDGRKAAHTLEPEATEPESE